jgi:DNA-binding transcriptional ArsR family regulator
MELDFETIKALSSPTRVKILRETMGREPTTTQISDELGKTKSTVSSHLKKLQEAGLVEKRSEEGRKRVIYSSTEKADAIIQGKSRKVRFSVLSSVSTAFIGAVLIFEGLRPMKSFQASRSQATALEAADAAAEEAAASGEPSLLLAVSGVLFLILTGLTLYYAKTISNLKKN